MAAAATVRPHLGKLQPGQKKSCHSVAFRTDYEIIFNLIRALENIRFCIAPRLWEN
jgi:hypothetical protein